MSDPTSLANLVSWWKGESGTSTTTDGTGISAWTPFAGSVSNNLTQSNGANQPIYDATHVSVNICAGPAAPNQFFNTTGITLARQNFSFFMIGELVTLREMPPLNEYHFACESTGDTLNLYYSGSGVSSARGALAAYDGSFKATTSVPPAGARVMLGWVGTAANLVTYVNTTSTTGTALSAGNSTLSQILGAGAAAYPLGIICKDIWIYSSSVTSSDVTNTLWPYAQTRGVPSSYLYNILCIGDSITSGYGDTVNRGWMQQMTLPSSYRLNNTAQSSIQAATLNSQIAFENSLFIGGTTNIAVVWAGTNDIALGGQTGASTYTTLTTYCHGLQSTGYKVILVTPLPRGTATISGEYANLRTAILGNAAAADAVADPLSDATLSAGWTATGGTYTYDGIHPNNAGSALIAPIVQTKIVSLLPSSTISNQGIIGALNRRIVGA